jgi:N4-gp56 family major capsid protein
MAGQRWLLDAEGGFLANTQLSKELRVAAQPMMKFRQFLRTEPGLGLHKGDTINFNKIRNVGTQGATLAETSMIPETNVQIARGSLQMLEYGNSIPYTGKLESLSEFSTDNIWTTALRNDMAKTLDKAVGDVFIGGGMRYASTGLTAGTFEATESTTATTQMTLAHVRAIVDAFKTGIFGTVLTAGNVTDPYDGQNYICIASREALRGIMNDPEWREVLLYADPNSILRGEVGMAEGVRFIETSFRDTLNVTAANAIGEAVFFGASPVIESIAVPENIRAKIPGDYGRDKGVAWYFLGGWARVWDDVSTGDNESHIVKFSGA